MTAFFSSRIIFAECLLFFGLIFYGRYDILYYILQKKAGMKPMKKCMLVVLFLCIVLLCACQKEDVQPTVPVQAQTAVAAQNGTPYAAIGSYAPGGAMVTAYSPDGTCYYAAFNYEDGNKAIEFTYDTATGAVLFRSDFYYTNGVLSSVISQATADKGYGYTLANGTIAACKKIETVYENGREIFKEYTDFSGNRFARTKVHYGTDGGFVRVWQENGRLRQLRSVAMDGAQLFTSDYGIVVGTWINCGAFGNATVVSIGADGSYTLLFTDRTHRLSDGTFYAGLDLYVVVNAAFDTAAAVYSKNGTTLCEYQTAYSADGSAKCTYNEYGIPVCTLQYDRTGKKTDTVSADGGDYFGTAPVAIGQAFGQGSVCEVNEDGSFTVVYFNRPYLHTDGTFTQNTTLYAFFDASRRLAGNKYYSGNKTVAECDYTYNPDGTFRVKVTEGETVNYFNQ